MVFEDLYRQGQRPKYDCLLFGKPFCSTHFACYSELPQGNDFNHMFELADLDDTLYPLSSGIATACLKNIKGKVPVVVNVNASDFSIIQPILYFWYVYMDDALGVGYMVEKLGIDESKIPDLCNLLYKNYGTTMAGLRVWFWFIYLFIYFAGKMGTH